MTRAIMNGCNGKMGQCITGICAQDEDIEIVAGIDTYDGIKNDYPVFASLKECTVDADVIIDFSNAKAVDALLAYGVEKQIPIVLCTTGLSEQQLADVEKAYEKVAILKSANMSLGIKSRIAEMYMHINKSRHHITSVRIDHTFGFFFRKFFSNLFYLLIFDQDICHLIHLCCRIDDMSPFN